LTIGATSFQDQVTDWRLENGAGEGDRTPTYSPEGEVVEDAEPEYTLNISFFHDWRVGGISDFLQVNRGQEAAFVAVQHADLAELTHHYSGTLKLKAPPAGGAAGENDAAEVELTVIGRPTYTRGLPA